MSHDLNENQNHSKRYHALMALSALGVVYGDIGTSPLYALKESFHHGHNIALTEASILGVLSLIFWSLAIVISVKYLMYVLKADNNGEGGILALTALISPHHKKNSKRRDKLVLFGLFGTALLYGDGMITPAISVLSAVEGLELITPVFTPYIIPITITILVALFSVQKFGTGVMGKVFGPLTLIWFLTLGSVGIYNVLKVPSIFLAINPYYAIKFFIDNQLNGFMVLGSVFLVVTGGEALYSDLGHFGRKPIERAWFFVALPCLVLNYFGQGAFLTQNPAAVKNPFFLMAPTWMLTPLVILATIATVIASQALITGVFSITMHAVHLGYIPRVLIKHTSKKEYGQIFVKSMNTMLMFACITLVIWFKTSSNLASAYGIAVTATMTITTLLFYVVAREQLKWRRHKAMLLCSFFMIIDLSFLGANITKIMDGGWVPLAVGLIIFTIMTTWKRGRKLLGEKIIGQVISLKKFLENIEKNKTVRAPGIAVYMTSGIENAPFALINTYEHFKAVHEHLVFLCVITEVVPHVEKSKRIEIKNIGKGCNIILIHYGYMDDINIPREIDQLKVDDIILKSNEITYFIGKEKVFATELPGMAIWREKLFAFQMANSQDATTYFRLPRKRVMEIGIQVEL